MKDLKEIQDVVACVIDYKTFFPVAKRLARDFKKVYYHYPGDEREFHKDCMGDGHDDVELLHNFWSKKKEIDLFVFPDIGDSDLQIELESQGFPVWGSKDADSYEKLRGLWIDTCEQIGLPMPKTHKIRGLTNLKLFFDEHEGETFHVKISKYRGDMETWKAVEPSQIGNKLDLLAMKFGPLKEGITFYVQEPVETEIESGIDTYFVNSQYPDKVILGYEKKAESYFATWKDRNQVAPELWKINEALAPLLEECNYCNTVSTEVRIADESYLLDPCLRFPSPAGEEELEMYSNFSEIVYYGARGQLVQPEMTAKFCGESLLSYCGDRDGWKSLRVPKEVEKWVKLYASIYDGECHHFAPDREPEALGCAIGLGDTPEEVIDALKEIQEALKDAPIEMNIPALADLFKEIKTAEEAGIEFSGQKLPSPAKVLS